MILAKTACKTEQKTLSSPKANVSEFNCVTATIQKKIIQIQEY